MTWDERARSIITALEAGTKCLAVASIALGLFIATKKLPIDYSYWMDELFSVSSASENLSTLLELIRSDVHPPLYSLVLKAWIAVFDSGEPSTRLFSWLCSIGALALLYRRTIVYGTAFALAALVFFSTNVLFAYYANETRAYALTLCFATALATSYPYRPTAPSLTFWISCVLLSLTHYFGLLIAGAALCIYLLQSCRQVREAVKVVLTGAACLVWPVYHLTCGSLMNKTGGNFWIEVTGFRDSFQIAASGYFAALGRFSGAVLWPSIIVAIAIGVYASKRGNDALRRLGAIASTAGMIVASLLLTVAAIDTWSPMSVMRNYIVLLPFLSLMAGASIAIAIEALPSLRLAFFAALVVFGALCNNQAAKVIARKASAPQDWKHASMILVEHAAGRQLYYTSALGGDVWREKAVNFYVKRISRGQLTLREFLANETALERPALVLFGNHKGEGEKAAALESALTKLGARQLVTGDRPVELLRGAVGVYQID